MSEVRWKDLQPDSALLDALGMADQRLSRAKALDATTSIPKNQWSKRFADGCAQMVAAEMRRNRAFRKLTILPDPAGKNEPPTFTTGKKKKKVDVLASSLVSGLQVGISLKGMNFRDRSGLNFDKNLTGRTYELQDEVRVIHQYQAAAYLVAIFFMPIAAASDKRGSKSVSSFARVVQHLRARTGRLDPTLPSQLDRVDMATVALYVPGDREQFSSTHRGRPMPFSYSDPFPRGVVRYFDVRVDPPRHGRPPVTSTMNLSELVDQIAFGYQGGSAAEEITWAKPESDDA